MENIPSTQSHSNIHSSLEWQWRQRRFKWLSVFIVSSEENGIAFYAAVIYRGNQRLHCLEGYLETTTAERAWLQCYQLCCEWRDTYHPNARLTIRPIDEQPAQQRGGRAA